MKGFRFGRDEKVFVASDENGSRHILGLKCGARGQRCCQLDGVISPQAVSLRKFDGAIDNGSIYRNKQEPVIAVLEKKAETPRSLFLSKSLRHSLFGC